MASDGIGAPDLPCRYFAGPLLTRCGFNTSPMIHPFLFFCGGIGGRLGTCGLLRVMRPSPSLELADAIRD